jgi:hypothetical protein
MRLVLLDDNLPNALKVYVIVVKLKVHHELSLQ